MSTPESGKAGRPKILVVDDQPANLVAASKLLSKLPVEVLCASSGDEALGLVLRHEFAVILMDVRMPIMDGYETATLIRGHTEQNPVPIIFVTAEAAEQHAMFHGYESGAVDYLLKPIDEDLLRSKIRIFVELYQHKRKLIEAGRALRQANLRMSRLLRAVYDGIVGIEPDGRVGFANPAACRLMECPPERLLNLPACDMFALAPATAADPQPPVDPFAEAAAHGTFRCSDAHFHSIGGRDFDAEYVLSAIDGEHPQQEPSFVLVFQDITDRHHAEEQLRHQAEVDHLTDLPNRLLFEQRVSQNLVRPGGRNRPFALMVLDLDGFKQINDRHGHAVGDYLLKAVADRLRGAARAVDTTARFGGDEFAILLVGLDDPRQALQLGHKIRSSLSQPYDCGGQPLTVGASVGVALYPLHGDSMAALMRAADRAMYRAKHDRRLGVVLADPFANDGAEPNEAAV